MKHGEIVSLGLVAILSAAMTAVAQGPPHEGMGPGMGPGMGGPGFGMHRPPIERMLGLNGSRWWNNPGMIEKLKLTDDQRNAMDQILLDHRKDLIDKRGAVEKAELDLEPLMQDDQPNESKVLAQIDKVAQARAELEKANARFLMAIRAKLSAEQWNELKAARSERMEHRWREDRDGRKQQGPPPAGNPGPGPQGLGNELPGFGIPNTDGDTGSR